MEHLATIFAAVIGGSATIIAAVINSNKDKKSPLPIKRVIATMAVGLSLTILIVVCFILNSKIRVFKSQISNFEHVVDSLSGMVTKAEKALDEYYDPANIADHRQVVQAIADKDLTKAYALNSKILQDFPWSPKAHYNQACILSLMAKNENNPEARLKTLDISQGFLEKSLKYGILSEIETPPGIITPMQVVLEDPDLEFLLSEKNGTLDFVEMTQKEKDKKDDFSTIGGGCISKEMKVLLPSGKYEYLKNISAGMEVMSWNENTRSIVKGKVVQVFNFNSEILLSFNDSILCTPSHPIKTPQGYFPAGDLRVGAQFSTSNQINWHIKSIKSVERNAEVIDITVEPFHNFIVNGVIVHNKVKNAPTKMVD